MTIGALLRIVLLLLIATPSPVRSGEADEFDVDPNDPAAERLRMEMDAIHRMQNATRHADAEQRAERRRRHLSFMASHQRIAMQRKPNPEELFPPRLRADYLRMRRAVRRQRGGGTLLERFLTLTLWTVPFVALIVWQLA